MSCKEQWQQEIARRLETAAKIAPGQVDGGQRCDHAGCKALVNLATGRCVKGHVQGTETIQRDDAELWGLVCLYREMSGSDRFTDRWDDDPRVQAISWYIHLDQPTPAQTEKVVGGLVEIFMEEELADDPRVQAAQWRVDPAGVVGNALRRNGGDYAEIEYTAETDEAQLQIARRDWEERWTAGLREAVESVAGDPDYATTAGGEETLHFNLRGRAGLQRLWAEVTRQERAVAATQQALDQRASPWQQVDTLLRKQYGVKASMTGAGAGRVELVVNGNDWWKLPEVLRREGLATLGAEVSLRVGSGEPVRVTLKESRVGDLADLLARSPQAKPPPGPRKGQPGYKLYEYLEKRADRLLVRDGLMVPPDNEAEARIFWLEVWNGLKREGLPVPAGVVCNPVVETEDRGGATLVVLAQATQPTAMPDLRVEVGHLEWPVREWAGNVPAADFVAQLERFRQTVEENARNYPRLHEAWQQGQHAAEVLPRPLTGAELEQRARESRSGTVDVVVAVPLADYMGALSGSTAGNDELLLDRLRALTVERDAPVAVHDVLAYAPVGLEPQAQQRNPRLLVRVKLDASGLYAEGDGDVE